MKGSWIPFLATTAALALAAVAPAQDRGRRGGGGGGGGNESRPTRNDPPKRSEPVRNDPPKRSEPTRTEPPKRNDPPRNEPTKRNDPPMRYEPPKTDPPRTEPTNPGRTNDPGSRDRRPTNPTTPPSNGGGDSRPTRSGGGNNDRRDPFDRSRNGGGDQGRSNPSDRSDRSSGGGVVIGAGGSPVRDRTSRSGKVSYGTRSNGFGNARPVRFGGGLNRNSLSAQIRRGDIRTGYNVSYGGVFGGLRVGYVGYNNYWVDDNFCYPFYVFSPWQSNTFCVASPWYRYSYLPGYINTTRVVVVNNYISPWSYNDWTNYDYRYNDRSRQQESLNNALDDIRDAFERNSSRYAERVLPQTGQVAIFNDGKYDYSLGADDFQDMYLDGVEQSKTVRYEVIESKVRGDEVRLRARHEYVDSWGANQVVFHSYTLRRERDGKYVIREFGTD